MQADELKFPLKTDWIKEKGICSKMSTKTVASYAELTLENTEWEVLPHSNPDLAPSDI
jgi:hypothetical protein